MILQCMGRRNQFHIQQHCMFSVSSGMIVDELNLARITVSVGSSCLTMFSLVFSTGMWLQASLT